MATERAMTLAELRDDIAGCRGTDPDYINEVSTCTFHGWLRTLDAHLCAKPVATIQPPDPNMSFDESSKGPWLGHRDWERLRALPPGTKLYTSASAQAQDADDGMCYCQEGVICPSCERRQAQKDCTWVQDSDGTWVTDCGNEFVLNEGTPSENDMCHCCYCGSTLKEMPYSDDDDTMSREGELWQSVTSSAR